MTSAETTAGAGIFLMALAEAFNVYGALNSSPWTAENFGADPEKARSCRRYVLQADAVNVALGVGTSLIAKNPWPLLGILVITIGQWLNGSYYAVSALVWILLGWLAAQRRPSPEPL